MITFFIADWYGKTFGDDIVFDILAFLASIEAGIETGLLVIWLFYA